MGFFSRKEKSPEEKLVDELVGSGFLANDNLMEVLGSFSHRNELQKIVKEAWKNGASVTEIQRIYDENLANFQKDENDNHIGFFVKNLSVDELFIDFTDLPVETQNFLDKIKQKPGKVYNFNENVKYVVKLIEKLALGIPAHIFITTVDNPKLEDVKSFASIAYNFEYNEGIKNKSLGEIERQREYGGAESGPSVFVILIVENVSGESIPKLIPGDWAGQTNKAMIYDFSKKVLYGKNGIHMKFFKKVLKRWGYLEDLPSNKKYFQVNML